MWQTIQGHDEVAARFRRILDRGRLASTYLFVGAEGIGKRSFALKLAECLLCQQTADAKLDRCGHCEPCRLADAGNHPDLSVVSKREDRQYLMLDQFIGDRDHRNREGLCHWLAIAPAMGRRRIAIVDDADFFNEESANALLKTLEEPPAKALIVLIGTSPHRQLPTIRSRCQMMRFRRLVDEAVARILHEHKLVDNLEQVTSVAALSLGSVSRAVVAADDEIASFSMQLRQLLSAEPPNSVHAAAIVRKFVESAGSKARVRRARLRTIINMTCNQYRNRLTELTYSAAADQHDMGNAIAVDRCVDRMQRCLDAVEQLDRNANQATLIEAWLADLEDA